MQASQLIERFHSLYLGNPDAYGGDDGLAIRRPFTVEVARAHLEGTSGCGVYPSFRHEGQLWTRWGCCDIDTGDWDEAYALAFTLGKMGMAPQVERSRSKGWHIWVHVDGIVESWAMRRALKVAYGIIDLPAREANPKQESLAPSQLGNYVRLPYKGGLAALRDRQVVVGGWSRTDDGCPVDLSDYLGSVELASPTRIRNHAARWYEPPRKVTVVRTDYTDEQAEQLIATLEPTLQALALKGPKNGDRSSGLMALAYKMALQQMAPNDVRMVVDMADRRWGKYHERPDGEVYITDIVERAFK